MSPNSNSRRFLFLKIGVTVILLAVALWMVDFGVLIDCVKEADVAPLGVAVAMLVLGGFAGAASWFCVLRMRLPELSYVQVAARHWSGMFFNSFLPSNVGGDVVKGCIVVREQGQAGFVVASLLADRVVNVGVLITIGVLTLLWDLGHAAWAFGLAAVLAGGVCGMSLAARLFHARWKAAALHGRWGRLLNAGLPLLELAGTPRLFVPMLAAASASQILKIWPHVWIIHAFHLTVPAESVWYLIPIFGVVSAIPISMNGLGVREVVAQSLAAPMHLDNTHLVALSLTSHLVFVLVNMFGAFPFLFARRKAR